MQRCSSRPRTEWVGLTGQDLLHGTYRILQGGCYYLAEDIDFGPNAGCCDYWPNLRDPPTFVNGQGEEEPLYPMGAYSLGFFAAITVEADDVVLDLNGKTIQASLAFSLKQVNL